MLRGSKSRSGAALSERGLVVDAGELLVRTVLEHDDVLELRRARQRIGDLLCVAAIVYERDGVAVVEHVAHLGRRVAIVDVHQRCTQLVDREHRLDRFDAVAHAQPDVRSGAHAVRGKMVREAVRALLELGVRAFVVTAGDGQPVGEVVHRVFEQIGDVVGHAQKLERVIVLRNPAM